MSIFDRLFGNGSPVNPVAQVAAAVVEQPFHVLALEQLNDLSIFVKKSSKFISTEVFSQLRVIHDILRELIGFLETHDTLVENQVVLTKIITEYIPDPLEMFLRLPTSEQINGGKADLLLREQYGILEKNARDLSIQVNEQVLSDLQTQAIFIKDRFETGV